MIKNINKKEVEFFSQMESFFLLDWMLKEKGGAFFRSFYKDGSKDSKEWIFERNSLHVERFRYLHGLQEAWIQKKENEKDGTIKKKKYISKKKQKTPKPCFWKKKISKKPWQILRKNPSLFFQENFFFSAIRPIVNEKSFYKKSLVELYPAGEYVLRHGFSYKIEKDTSLSSFLGNKISIHWIRGNTMGGNSQYVLDSILFFLKKRVPYRRICSILFQELRRLSYIEGIRITYAGRLGGKTNKAIRSKKETRKIGKPSLHIFSAKIDFAQGEVETKFGMIGIKVWIRYK